MTEYSFKPLYAWSLKSVQLILSGFLLHIATHHAQEKHLHDFNQSFTISVRGKITRLFKHSKATDLGWLCDPNQQAYNQDWLIGVNLGRRLHSERFWLAEQQLFTLPWSKKRAGSPSIMGCSWGPLRLLDGEPCLWRVIRKEPLRTLTQKSALPTTPAALNWP